jgi:hypothetical protein
MRAKSEEDRQKFEERFREQRQEFEERFREQAEVNRKQAEVNRKQAEVNRKQGVKQLVLFSGNALIDLARFILKLNPQDSSHSTHRLVQLAQNISVKQLQELSIPTKYYSLLQKLPRVSIE